MSVETFFIVIGSFVSEMLSCGYPYSVGVLFSAWCDYFDDTPRLIISWISAINTGILSGLGPFVSFLGDRIGYQRCYIIGFIISAVSAVACSFATEVYHLILFYGVFAGIGFSMSFVATVVILHLRIKVNYQAASGFAATGVAAGIMTGALFFQFLIDTYTWRGCLLLFGALQLNGLIFGPYMKVPELPRQCCSKRSQNVEAKGKTPAQSSRSTRFKALLRNVCFPQHIINNCLSFIGNFIFFTVLARHIQLAGFSSQLAAFILTINGCSNLIARCLTSVAGLQHRVRSVEFYGFGMFGCGVNILLVPWVHDYNGFLIISALHGFCYGIYMATEPSAMADLVPIWLLPDALGYGYFFDGLGAVLGPPVAGWIFDHNGSFNAAFVFGGVCSAIGGAWELEVALLSRYLARVKRRNDVDISLPSLVFEDPLLQPKEKEIIEDFS